MESKVQRVEYMKALTRVLKVRGIFVLYNSSFNNGFNHEECIFVYPVS